MPETAAHSISPTAVGSAAPSRVHFKLPVSFFIVISEVEQGKWQSINISVHTAVTGVQPFASRIFFSESRFS